MFEYLNAWAAAATIAGALFAAIKWVLIQPITKQLHDINMRLDQKSNRLDKQVDRVDHLYQISNELMATMIKWRK